MINYLLVYFVNVEGKVGIEYEFSKVFVDYLVVEFDIMLFDNSE